MYNQEAIAEKNLTLSFEFERYLLENPEWLETIPSGAEIVLLPKRNFCAIRAKIAQKCTE